MPRSVPSLDEGAAAAVTQLYREYLPAGGAVLDLMSSRTSHLPPEVAYRRVAGIGREREELAANDRLTEFVVQDLNEDKRLPFAAGEFDAATLCAAFDLLSDPIAILREVARVLRPGAPLVVTFSNRSLPSQAMPVWHGLEDIGRCGVVAALFRAAGAEYWSRVETLDRSPGGEGEGDRVYAVVSRRQL